MHQPIDRIETISAVASAADRALAARATNKEAVLAELARMAFANVHEFLTVDEEGRADLRSLTRDQAAAIEEVVIEFADAREVKTGGKVRKSAGDGREGEAGNNADDANNSDKGDARKVKRLRFKLADKRAALVDLARHLGLFAQPHAPAFEPPPRTEAEARARVAAGLAALDEDGCNLLTLLPEKYRR
jgi:phage terminase small subunit